MTKFANLLFWKSAKQNNDFLKEDESTEAKTLLGHVMRKRVFWNMRTVQAQISLHIRGIPYPQTETLNTIEYFSGEQMPGWDFAHVQDDLNPDILRMLEGPVGNMFE